MPQTATSTSDWVASVEGDEVFQLVLHDNETGATLSVPIESPIDARSIASALLAQISDRYGVDVSPDALDY